MWKVGSNKGGMSYSFQIKKKVLKRSIVKEENKEKIILHGKIVIHRLAALQRKIKKLIYV